MGIATHKPSGTLWIATAIPSDAPEPTSETVERKVASPSGKLWIAMATAPRLLRLVHFTRRRHLDSDVGRVSFLRSGTRRSRRPCGRIGVRRAAVVTVSPPRQFHHQHLQQHTREHAKEEHEGAQRRRASFAELAAVLDRPERLGKDLDEGDVEHHTGRDRERDTQDCVLGHPLNEFGEEDERTSKGRGQTGADADDNCGGNVGRVPTEVVTLVRRRDERWQGGRRHVHCETSREYVHVERRSDGEHGRLTSPSSSGGETGGGAL
eukprot:5794644-Prymnesium_polylepis.1